MASLDSWLISSYSWRTDKNSSSTTIWPLKIIVGVYGFRSQNAIESPLQTRVLVFILVMVRSVPLATDSAYISKTINLLHPALLYVPPGLIPKNSTFCQHNASVRYTLSDNKTNTSLTSIKWLVFITKEYGFYYAVGDKYLNTLHDIHFLTVPTNTLVCYYVLQS
jgi:hypothetical protein